LAKFFTRPPACKRGPTLIRAAESFALDKIWTPNGFKPVSKP
jgi:hypothetical protein